VRAALGLKARTGRAVLVALGGDLGEPQLLERSQLPLLPAGAWAPYHAAERLEAAAANESVERSIASARRLATSGLREAVRRLAAAGHEVRACAVLVGTGMPNWSTADILAVHVRMHKAEGELFRDVLVEGARACDLELATLADKSALDDAANVLGLTRAGLEACLRTLGKSAGPPWGKDQKEAAAAALVALDRIGPRDDQNATAWSRASSCR
jgi:hypothetical protein